MANLHNKSDCLVCGGHPEDADEMRRMIKETHLAVVGHEKIGVSGLVLRMYRVERKQRRQTWYLTIIAAASLGSAIGFKEFLLHIFK